MIVAHAVAFLAPVLLLALRDRRIAALGALTGIAVLSGSTQCARSSRACTVPASCARCSRRSGCSPRAAAVRRAPDGDLLARLLGALSRSGRRPDMPSARRRSRCASSSDLRVELERHADARDAEAQPRASALGRRRSDALRRLSCPTRRRAAASAIASPSASARWPGARSARRGRRRPRRRLDEERALGDSAPGARDRGPSAMPSAPGSGGSAEQLEQRSARGRCGARAGDAARRSPGARTMQRHVDEVGRDRVAVAEPDALLAHRLAVVGGQRDTQRSCARSRPAPPSKRAEPGVEVAHLAGVARAVLARQRTPSSAW